MSNEEKNILNEKEEEELGNMSNEEKNILNEKEEEESGNMSNEEKNMLKEKKTPIVSQMGSTGSIKLRRELGLFSAVNLILGVMIGSGIFVSPASALEHSGSVALCLVIWIVSGLISFLGALSFAELGTVLGKSGAEYAYFQEAFGNCHKFWGPLPAFICAWIYVVILRPAEVAIIVMTFAEYAMHAFTSNLESEYKDTAIKLTSLLALFLITYVNMTSVRLFVRAQNVFGVCKVCACLLVIGGGAWHVAQGNTELLATGWEGSRWSPGSVALALYSGLWAYDGWNSVTVVTEEIINPSVNVPLSISLAVPLMTLLYTLMNAAYLAVLPRGALAAAPAVAVAWAPAALGPLAPLVPVGVAVATFGCAMSVQFGVTRVCYTAARGGHMLQAFSFVHLTRRTPAIAVAFQAVLTSVFILIGNIRTLIEFASWFLWFFYGLAMVALLVLRRTAADRPRPYRVPTPAPLLVLAAAVLLSVLPIVHDPSLKYVAAVGLMLLGVVVYTVFIYYRKTPDRILDKMTLAVQKLCLSVPPSSHASED